MDVSAEYFKATGDFMDDSQKAVALEEINKIAPSNVTTLEGVDAVETVMPMGGVKPKLTLGEGKLNYPAIEKQLGVKLRGNETFDELLEIEKNTKKSQQGLASLFPRGKPGEIFDVDTSKRDDVADFVKKMRKEGIANKDIKGVFKEFGTDIEGGKRAATTLARAADMKADTKVKQELLSELDEMKMDNSPRFFQEEYMGYDDFISAIEAKKIEVNNAIVDDLEAMGVPDEKISDIMGIARRQRDSNFYTSGEEFVDVIKEELDFNDIKYDVEFYKNYFKELESLLRKPEPRFAYGGMI